MPRNHEQSTGTRCTIHGTTLLVGEGLEVGTRFLSVALLDLLNIVFSTAAGHS